jgi:hypothetical protein
MTQIKYPAARAVIGLLKNAGLRVIHYGSPANNDVKPEPGYFDDLDLLLRAEDIDAFHSTMEGAGYRLILDNPHTGEATEPAPEWKAQHRYALGGSPACYSLEVKWPSDLWISFSTTWQHWPLDLVDLGHWFDVAETVTVMGDTEVERAPLWARLLWNAHETAQAARKHHPELGHAVHEVALFAGAPNLDWDLVAERIIQYDVEALQRRSRLEPFYDKCSRERVVGPVPDEKGEVINHCYYILQAVEEYYPGTVPASVLGKLGPLVEGRTIVVDLRDDPDWTVRYGLAEEKDVVTVPDFGVKEQIEKYGNLSAVEMLSQGILQPAVYWGLQSGAAWDLFTKQDLTATFAPL